jgi:hypothetical protein
MCLLPDTTDKTSVKPSADQLTSMRKLTETYDADLQCSNDVAVAELKLWYRSRQKLINAPAVLLMPFGCATMTRYLAQRSYCKLWPQCL